MLSINPMAQRLFETDERCVGRGLLTVERSPEVSAAIQTALQSGYCEPQLARGEHIYQLDISVISSGGAVIGAVILVFDVTENARAEQSRREFTANVSHELKTPLQSIMRQRRADRKRSGGGAGYAAFRGAYPHRSGAISEPDRGYHSPLAAR